MVCKGESCIFIFRFYNMVGTLEIYWAYCRKNVWNSRENIHLYGTFPHLELTFLGNLLYS